MGDDYVSILDALSTASIEHDAKSLRKYHSQGLMSTVYTIATPQGELIIHVSKLTPSLEQFHIWEKLKPVSQFLLKIPGVPAAEVLYTIKLQHHFIAVQRKLPGHTAGSVEFKDGTIVLTWKEPAAPLEKQMEDIVANIHAAPIQGFGQLVINNTDMRGQYSSWEEFLRNDMSVWLNGISEADRYLKTPQDELIKNARSFFEQSIGRVAELEHASLVSCDAMNPSNVLVENGAVTGIVDWEWALAADPAWEFSYMNQFSLRHYFSRFPTLSNTQSQRDFLKRAQIYEYFLYTMWCFAISGDPESHFYRVTRDRLQKKLSGADEFLKRLDQE